LLVPQNLAIERAVKNLDRIPPYETHKVGVIYVGQGQASNEAEILRNQFGSLRYAEFLQVSLSDFLTNMIQKYADNKLQCKGWCHKQESCHWLGTNVLFWRSGSLIWSLVAQRKWWTTCREIKSNVISES
jgi:hypothetical protein